MSSPDVHVSPRIVIMGNISRPTIMNKNILQQKLCCQLLVEKYTGALQNDAYLHRETHIAGFHFPVHTHAALNNASRHIS
jgi:hypothetical protein